MLVMPSVYLLTTHPKAAKPARISAHAVTMFGSRINFRYAQRSVLKVVAIAASVPACETKSLFLELLSSRLGR